MVDIQVSYIKENDAEGLCHLMTSNAKIFDRFFPMTLGSNLNVEDSRKFVSKKINEIASKLEYTFTLKNKETGHIVGLVILKNINWKALEGELAYCLDSKMHGQGYMTSGVAFVSGYAIEKLGLNVLKIIAHKSNIPSIRVAEKCNFAWKKTLKKAYEPPNEPPLDMELYELRHEEHVL